jgi:predicted lipoprotein with Yx(FWY)xxD motif
VRSFVLATLVVVAAATFVAGSSASAGSQATLTVRSSSYGSILFDGRGRALYAFTRDQRGGPSRCYGACAQKWPVYFSGGRLVAGKGVKRSLIGTTKRRDGRRQITYNGRPLYYYNADKIGQVLCQNVAEFGGTWLVVRPSGALVR